MRISLGGGGTDLPSYYRQFGGFCISAAIDKYVYITLHETFEQEIVVKYSQMEKVKTVAQIKHPIVREALTMLWDGQLHMEIASHADIPAGTGLGSSSSFTTALLKAISIYHGVYVPTSWLAERACIIEIDYLHEPIGKQDQYISAYGGLKVLHFKENDCVEVEPLVIDAFAKHDLEDSLMLFFTGYSRSASDILSIQDAQTKANNNYMIDNLHMVKKFGGQIRQALEHDRLDDFAALMDQHWEYKKERAPGMTNPHIDELYEIGKRHGALGGKLVGAGGGGFLMFYTRDRQKLRHAMLNCGLKEVRFRFDFEGCKVIAQ
jgi:D-glycero-alpha-D-manno-heptose-7-phosphate kinase